VGENFGKHKCVVKQGRKAGRERGSVRDQEGEGDLLFELDSIEGL